MPPWIFQSTNTNCVSKVDTGISKVYLSKSISRFSYDGYSVQQINAWVKQVIASAWAQAWLLSERLDKTKIIVIWKHYFRIDDLEEADD
jgi:hypothetical protein